MSCYPLNRVVVPKIAGLSLSVILDTQWSCRENAVPRITVADAPYHGEEEIRDRSGRRRVGAPPRTPPAPGKRAYPRTHDLVAILDAVFYVLKSGCPCRLLPRDFSP
jgi:hypothetical protein